MTQVQPEPGCCPRGDHAKGGGRGLPVAGQLGVRRDHRGEGLVLWLSGELNRATSSLLEHELDTAQPARAARRIIDLSALEFIDAGGLRTLAQAQQHARASGDQFSIQGSRMVEQLLELTSSDQVTSRPVSGERAVGDEHYYLALAMAGANADHQRPERDRPRGEGMPVPGLAAAASGASLLGVARAAPGDTL